jgi:hypothetical protein
MITAGRVNNKMPPRCGLPRLHTYGVTQTLNQFGGCVAASFTICYVSFKLCDLAARESRSSSMRSRNVLVNPQARPEAPAGIVEVGIRTDINADNVVSIFKFQRLNCVCLRQIWNFAFGTKWRRIGLARAGGRYFAGGGLEVTAGLLVWTNRACWRTTGLSSSATPWEAAIGGLRWHPSGGSALINTGALEMTSTGMTAGGDRTGAVQPATSRPGYLANQCHISITPSSSHAAFVHSGRLPQTGTCRRCGCIRDFQGIRPQRLLR